ncbi:MAG TPA: hypothetical protein VHQ45_18045 [Gemmatimonadaceae bacterium]|jgi:hypothetical protein|nr:hypothetical protein [Gemmatimonadaceae bacterium]
MTSMLAHQAARAQALLDRIAEVSDVRDVPGESAGIDLVVEALGQREALLADLQPVVAQLGALRSQMVAQSAASPSAHAYALALAPVEQAAGRALHFHQVLLDKLQAMRAEVVGELDHLDRLGELATAYGANEPGVRRLDLRR